MVKFYVPNSDDSLKRAMRDLKLDQQPVLSREEKGKDVSKALKLKFGDTTISSHTKKKPKYKTKVRFR